MNIPCIICLDDIPIKINENIDYIKPVPCSCKIYSHQSCFNKTQQNHCIVCKRPYQYRGKKYLHISIQENTENSNFQNIFPMCLKSVKRCIILTLEYLFIKCIPVIILITSLVLLWMIGLITNMILYGFFNKNIPNSKLELNSIWIMIYGLSSTILFYIIYKIKTHCIKSVTENNVELNNEMEESNIEIIV